MGGGRNAVSHDSHSPYVDYDKQEHHTRYH